MKKVIVSMGAVAMGLALAGTAFASSSTGSHSPVTTKVISITSTSVSNSNTATVTNEANSAAFSGQNSITTQNGDVNGASIMSGNAASSVVVNNQVNGIQSTVTALPTTNNEAPAAPSDTTNGSNSKVTTTIVQKDAATLANANSTQAANAVSAVSGTGQNKVGVTKNGDVNTAGIVSGVASGTTSVGNVFGVITSVFNR